MSSSSECDQNVRVYCKLRPQSKIEDRKGSNVSVSSTDTTIEIDAADRKQQFSFDRVFSPHITQEEVYQSIGVNLVQDLLQGFNCTLFAYGQSGSGKTFTMEGPKHSGEMAGLTPRIVNAIFEQIKDRTLKANGSVAFAVKVSYVEIYNEKIRDLLDPSRTKVNLQVRQDKVKGVYVEDVTEEFADSGETALAIMDRGSKMRATAATGMNDTSSRSHSVFQVSVIQGDHAAETEKSSRMTLIDLAGSETVKKTGAEGAQMEEAKAINKSLSALGQVIKALTSPNATHIPFRDSKLTRMLQEAIGGNSRTTLVICCSPSRYNAEETVSTCRFGARAKAITNKAVVNELRSAKELERLLKSAEREVRLYRARCKGYLGLLREQGVEVGEEADQLPDLPDNNNSSNRRGRRGAPMLRDMADGRDRLSDSSVAQDGEGDDCDDGFRNSFWVKDRDSEEIGLDLGRLTSTTMKKQTKTVDGLRREAELVEAKLEVRRLTKELAAKAATDTEKEAAEQGEKKAQEQQERLQAQLEEVEREAQEAAEAFECEEQALREQLVARQEEVCRLENSKEAARLLEAENERERLAMEQSRAHLQCKELKKTLEQRELEHKLALKEFRSAQMREAKRAVMEAVKETRRAMDRAKELESHCALAKRELATARRESERLQQQLGASLKASAAHAQAPVRGGGRGGIHSIIHSSTHSSIHSSGRHGAGRAPSFCRLRSSSEGSIQVPTESSKEKVAAGARVRRAAKKSNSAKSVVKKASSRKLTKVPKTKTTATKTAPRTAPRAPRATAP